MASGDTLFKFNALSKLSGSATIDTRNDHFVLDFALTENAIFGDILENYANGGIDVNFHFSMTSATADDIKIQASIERIGDQQLDVDTDSFAAAQDSGDITVPATSGNVDVITVSFLHSEIDGLLNGEQFRIKVERAAVAGTDATGDLELHYVRGIET